MPCSSGWRSIHTIDTCIALRKAPRGVANITAVLSYCGVPIQMWENGALANALDGLIPRQCLSERRAHRRGAVCDIPTWSCFIH